MASDFNKIIAGAAAGATLGVGAAAVGYNLVPNQTTNQDTAPTHEVTSSHEFDRFDDLGTEIVNNTLKALQRSTSGSELSGVDEDGWSFNNKTASIDHTGADSDVSGETRVNFISQTGKVIALGAAGYKDDKGEWNGDNFEITIHIPELQGKTDVSPEQIGTILDQATSPDNSNSNYTIEMVSANGYNTYNESFLFSRDENGQFVSFGKEVLVDGDRLPRVHASAPDADRSFKIAEERLIGISDYVNRISGDTTAA